MKKIGFLSFGIVVVILILSLQNFEGVSSHVRRIFLEVAHDVREKLVEMYYDLQSLVTIEGV